MVPNISKIQDFEGRKPEQVVVLWKRSKLENKLGIRQGRKCKAPNSKSEDGPPF